MPLTVEDRSLNSRPALGRPGSNRRNPAAPSNLCLSDAYLETALANPKDKFKIGIRKLIEGLMIQRLDENDKIVMRYVEDRDFQNVAFNGLADEIFASVVAEH